jgi:hypothetical protein
MLSILEDHFMYITDYYGFQLSTDKEKQLFSPYDWEVINKLAKRKYTELFMMDNTVSLEFMVSEIEDILCKLMNLKYLSSAQLVELTKLIHHHHVSRNLKK